MEFDEKSNFYILNGEYHQGKLQDLLNNFIIQFVLCQSCENPETELVKGNFFDFIIIEKWIV